MKEIVNLFRHIIYDIFNFCIGGFVTLINIFYIDLLFYESVVFHKIRNIDYWEIILIGICYILGQATSCIMYFIFDKTKIQEWTCKLIILSKNEGEEIDKNINSAYKQEIDAFVKNKELFEQFPLRFKQLYYVRWNISSAFFITGVGNFIYSLLYWNFNYNLTIISVLLILLGFLQYMLVLKFENESYQRLNYILNPDSNKACEKANECKDFKKFEK